jgi:FkbM family methyltransferase
MLPKIKFIFCIIRNFKNWFIWFQDRLSLPNPYYPHQELIAYLRNDVKFHFHFKSGEIGTISEIWCKKIYTKNLPIEDGDIIIDIGANIGAFSIFAAKNAKNIKVFAYEPSPVAFSTLVKNIKENNLEKVIFPFKMGVAGKRGKRILFFRSNGSDTTDTIIEKHKEIMRHNANLEINVTELEDIFKINNLNYCNFLKIDAEGAEYEILFNTPAKIVRKIEKIALEYHDGYENIEKFLRNHGFYVSHQPTIKNEGILWARNINFYGK